MCWALYMVPSIARFKRSFASEPRTIRAEGRIVKAAAPARNSRRVVLMGMGDRVLYYEDVREQTPSNRPAVAVFVLEKLRRLRMIRDLSGSGAELQHLPR